MMELADEIVIGHASPGENLERLCGEYQGKHATVYGKPVTIGPSSVNFTKFTNK